MRLLTWLTVIYAVVLVLALAASLITIFVYLWRIGSALALVRDALAQVRENTAPLEGHVTAINGGLVQVGEGLTAVDGHLTLIDESLEGVASHLGLGETV